MMRQRRRELLPSEYERSRCVEGDCSERFSTLQLLSSIKFRALNSTTLPRLSENFGMLRGTKSCRATCHVRGS
jgi:hypothetical protein